MCQVLKAKGPPREGERAVWGELGVVRKQDQRQDSPASQICKQQASIVLKSVLISNLLWTLQPKIPQVALYLFQTSGCPWVGMHMEPRVTEFLLQATFCKVGTTQCVSPTCWPSFPHPNTYRWNQMEINTKDSTKGKEATTGPYSQIMWTEGGERPFQFL